MGIAERLNDDFDSIFEQKKDTDEKEQRAADLIIKSRRYGLTLMESFELAKLVGIDKKLVE